MIETMQAEGEVGAQRWVLKPNRSLDLRQARRFFALVVATSVLVSGYSWTQGNVFAPVFAVAELSVLALVFWVVWRRAERAEVISINPDRVSVNRVPELVEALSEPTPWVRIEARDGQLYLASRGRRVDVGRFLGEAEREQLAKDLEHGLRQARAQSVYRFTEDSR
ncbi:DUF2244 domain-containing protein [Aquimonas voraii]|uniref:Uncharacterized membrane protein n=1 Tax=Aquimonas voraii TaxID=265719 RepID=A0A1G6Y075_9GAMM|nr:DUF2244 domain-containing protein [Aquimonas voraii]SDD83681.1 Uncharacterized membrane protein [Aquimonas voraii]